MSVRVLVRRNALDPYRSRSLWFLLGLFVLAFGLIGYMVGGSPLALTGIAVSIMAVLAPLAALAMTYGSIAGPRESGALRVLLSYPYTRRELVLGTLIGRILILALAVTVGLVTGVVSSTIFGGSVDLASMGQIVLVSILLATTFVGIAMGISASVRTSSWAAVAAFGAYLLFTGFWNTIPSLARYALNGFAFPTGPPPEWVAIWRELSPTRAYQVASGVVEFPTADLFYQTTWFAVLVLVVWFALAVVVGVLRFEGTDL